MVLLKRRANAAGFDVRITITLECTINDKTKRVLALDLNAGHTDFAVLDKSKGALLAIGKINHHETQYTRRRRRDALLYKMTEKIGNLARHYDTEVVVHLNTGKYKVRSKKATRKVRQMPQYRFRQILTQQLTRRGIKVTERSEAYTSKLGREFAAAWGLDVHKGAAVFFTLKVVNYPLFRRLKILILSDGSSASDEGDGSLRRMLCQRILRELTAPHQNRRHSLRNWMKFWCAMKLTEEKGSLSVKRGDPVMPGNWGLSFLESLLNSTFAYHHVKIS